MSKTICVQPPIIVKELAERIRITPYLLIHDLVDMNQFAAINWSFTPEFSSAMCEKYGFELALA